MFEKIKKAALNYYLLNFKKITTKGTFREREQFIKKLLNRVAYPIGFFGIILIWKTIFNYPLIAKFVFPFFMLYLIPLKDLKNFLIQFSQLQRIIVANLHSMKRLVKH